MRNLVQFAFISFVVGKYGIHSIILMFCYLNPDHCFSGKFLLKKQAFIEYQIISVVYRVKDKFLFKMILYKKERNLCKPLHKKCELF